MSVKWPMGPSLHVTAVWLVTFLGFLLGVVGVAALPSLSAAPWLAASVAVDALDGWLARRWEADTEYGARLDWTVDTALSYSIVVRLLPSSPLLAVSCMVGLLGMQTGGVWLGHRASGRTLVTCLALAVPLLARGPL